MYRVTNHLRLFCFGKAADLKAFDQAVKDGKYPWLQPTESILDEARENLSLDCELRTAGIPGYNEADPAPLFAPVVAEHPQVVFLGVGNFENDDYDDEVGATLFFALDGEIQDNQTLQVTMSNADTEKYPEDEISQEDIEDAGMGRWEQYAVRATFGDKYQEFVNEFFFYDGWGGTAGRFVPAELWQNEAFCEAVLWASLCINNAQQLGLGSPIDDSDAFWGDRDLEYFPESFIEKHHLRTAQRCAQLVVHDLMEVCEIPEEFQEESVYQTVLENNKGALMVQFNYIPERFKTWDLCLLYVQDCLDSGDHTIGDMDDPDGFMYCVPQELHEKLKEHFKS